MILWVLLYFAGLGLLMAELFIPSAGILAIAAAVAIGFAIYQMYVESAFIAIFAILVTFVYIVFLIKFWTRRLSHKRVLSQEEVIGSDRRFESLIGLEGDTTTKLRPAGFAIIDGRRVPVVSEGKFIDKGARIRVLNTSGNRVVVTELEAPPRPGRGEPLFRRE